MTDARDVFISYHEETAGKLAGQICEELDKFGISCWYAKRDLPIGGDFAAYIPAQIQRCKVFLLLINKGSVQSRHVENELGLAFRRYNKTGDIQIFPYKLEECALSSWMDYYFVHTQIKAFPNDMRNLVSQIASRLKHELTSNEHIQNNVPPLQSISFEHDAEQKNKVLNSIFENYAHALSKRIRNLVFAPCKVTLDSEAVFTKYWTCDVISGMIRKNV